MASLTKALSWPFDDVFAGGQSKATLLRTKPQKRAEKFIEQIYQRNVPEYPVRPVAGLSPLEQQRSEMVTSYAGKGTEGTDYLRSILAESGDITEMPEYKALLSKVFEQGNLMANRLGRTLQMRGAATGTPGADMLGRTVEDIESSALATLAPYASAERGRKVSAAESLASLSETAVLNRLNALSTQGTLERQLEQLRQDAEWEKTMRELNWPYEMQAPLAMGLLNAQTPWSVSPPEPSFIEQIAPLLQMGGQMMMQGA